MNDGTSIISDDDDDESYVPDSLRDFLKAADEKLEADLSFLSPPEPSAMLIVNDDDNDGDDVGHTILRNNLEREMEKARQKDMERAAAMEQERKNQAERERKKIDQERLEEEREQKRLKEMQAEKLATATSMEDDEDDEDPNTSASPLLNIIHPSADVSESHVKRIAMEGADQDSSDEEEGLQPLVAMVEGKSTEPPAPSPMIDKGAVAKGNEGRVSAVSPSLATKVGRKLEMELDAEAQRSSLLSSSALPSPSPSQKREEHNNNSNILSTQLAEGGNGPDNMEIDNSNTDDINTSLHESLEEKQKSIREKQQRLSELQIQSAERRRRIKEFDDEDIERHSLQIDATPSNAAAAAADEAAAVVANKNTDATANSNDEGPIAVPDTSLVETNKTNTMPRKLAVTGPVKALPVHHSRMRQQPQSRQQRSFRGRDPPRPKEIITRTNFSEDGGARSVSPLGGEGGLESPQMHSTTYPKLVRRGPLSYDYQKDQEKPLRPSPSKRRQLTRPDSAFDRLSRPTAASSAGRAGAARGRAKVNTEDEQRKARERIRKRMAMQRKKTKKNNGFQLPSSPTEASKKAKARKERIEQIEKERLAKIKAKIEAREERLQMKKKEEAKKNKLKLKQRITTQQTRKASENGSQGVKPCLTVPVAPKFATDRRLASGRRKTEVKEEMSLASSTGKFGQGLRSSTPTVSRPTNTSELRRLTIPRAPKFATSQRLGDKSKAAPSTSPTKKNARDYSDNISWSSMLRDVSAIGSPVSKAASSVKTGPLTIPVTPQFQPIRKRPLPKSSAEREMEEIQHYKEHKYKARMVKMQQPLSLPRSQKPIPKRKLTTPEPFHFNASRSHKRDHRDTKEDLTSSSKALPKSKLSSQYPISNKKKSTQARSLTTPEPFRFHTSSKRSHVESKEESPSETESFKALPMPDFKKVVSKKKSPQARTLTTPEPFRFNTSSKKSLEKNKEESPSVTESFKALPMPDFKKVVSKKKSPQARTITTPEPFQLHESNRRDRGNADEELEDKATFRARPMPNFSKTPSLSMHSNSTATKERKNDRTKRKSTRPTGASGLLFHPSFTSSSRLSRPRVLQEPPKLEIKPFRARPMPDFIPDVIVTRTPAKDHHEGETAYKREGELENDLSPLDTPKFQARPMPNFDKVDIPVKDKNPISPPPSKKKEDDYVFKASPAPKNMLDEPSIPVRRRDPKKLRSPESVKKGSSPSPSKPQSPPYYSPVASPHDNKAGSPDPSNVMEDAKARLRERLSKRRSNAAAVKAATPDRDKSKSKKNTPKAFSTLQVQSRLNALSQTNINPEEDNAPATENTPRKSNSRVPRSIDLPLRSASPKENRKLSVGSGKKKAATSSGDVATPKIANSRIDGPSEIAPNDPEKEASLLRETKLALALGLPDGDESSSILQLAQDVQKAAEDELSFYSTEDHWSAKLLDAQQFQSSN